jgi:hypothetical protein
MLLLLDRGPGVKKLHGEALTLIPSLVMFISAIYLAGFTLIVGGDYQRIRLFTFLSVCFMLAGLIFAFLWFFYWGISRVVFPRKERNDNQLKYVHFVIGNLESF